jgi:PTH1 family peptidyl-tRNA hydrolase
VVLDVIVGLGNEGEAYKYTRHNLGAYFVDACVAFAAIHPLWRKDLSLYCSYTCVNWHGQCRYFVKPLGFMNETGRGLQLWLSFFKKCSKNVLLCCDDITISLGEVKITSRPGTAGHHGVEDVWDRIGPGFTRFRLGIGPKRYPEMDLKDHVLGHFSETEQARVDAGLSSWIKQLEPLLDKEQTLPLNVP